MLGVRTERKPIGGDIAKEIRSAIRRVSTGNLNDKEKSRVARSQKILSQFNVHWIDLKGNEI